MRRAVGEVLTALGAATGFGEAAGSDRPPLRRGPALLALQTAVVAVVVAVVFLIRRWIGGVDGTIGFGLILMAVLCLLPMAIHWLAAPPRRVVGLLAGLATAAGLLAIGVTLLGIDPPWLGLTVVGVPMVIGSAVFGAVSTVERTGSET